MPCFDDQGKPIGRQVASGITSTSPGQLIGAMIDLTHKEC